MNHSPVRFDPDRVAYFEAEGWRAYYDRKWLRLLRLLIQLNQEQFRIPFPRSLLAAYDVTRGSIAWVPVDHDLERITDYFRKFYRLAARCSGLGFDPERVAELEIRYYDVHRELVRQDDKRELIDVMTQLHSALFGLTPEQARESAKWRIEAVNTVDRITGKTSTDPEADWTLTEECLRRCYRSVLAHDPSARIATSALVPD